MARRWPGEPGSAERRAAYAEDRARRAERARELYPDEPRKARAAARGHPEDVPGTIGMRQARWLRDAENLYLPPPERQPDGTLRRIIVRDVDGRKQAQYLPDGYDPEDLEDLDVPEPEDTP